MPISKIKRRRRSSSSSSLLRADFRSFHQQLVADCGVDASMKVVQSASLMKMVQPCLVAHES